MGFRLANRFIYYPQDVITNNYNSIADFHTTDHSRLSILSLFPLVSTRQQLSVMAIPLQDFTRRLLVTISFWGQPSFAARSVCHLVLYMLIDASEQCIVSIVSVGDEDIDKMQVSRNLWRWTQYFAPKHWWTSSYRSITIGVLPEWKLL
jgi:hypothetical protein